MIYVYETMFMKSLNVNMAFGVARPRVEEGILTAMGVHGLTVAAVIDEMCDIRETAQFENCEAEFGYSRCIRRDRVEAVLERLES